MILVLVSQGESRRRSFIFRVAGYLCEMVLCYWSYQGLRGKDCLCTSPSSAHALAVLSLSDSVCLFLSISLSLLLFLLPLSFPSPPLSCYFFFYWKFFEKMTIFSRLSILRHSSTTLQQVSSTVGKNLLIIISLLKPVLVMNATTNLTNIQRRKPPVTKFRSLTRNILSCHCYFPKYMFLLFLICRYIFYNLVCIKSYMIRICLFSLNFEYPPRAHHLFRNGRFLWIRLGTFIMNGARALLLKLSFPLFHSGILLESSVCFCCDPRKFVWRWFYKLSLPFVLCIWFF